MKLLVAVLLLLAASASANDGPERSQPSPRTFVGVGSCSDGGACPAGYWAFEAPDCPYRGVSHAPGTVILLTGGVTFQCRWIDVQEAREEE